MNQYAAQNSKPAVGFLNPTLYGLLKGDKALTHDVVGNKSGVFRSVKGYDLVGGLGSPNGLKTIKAVVGQ